MKKTMLISSLIHLLIFFQLMLEFMNVVMKMISRFQKNSSNVLILITMFLPIQYYLLLLLIQVNSTSFLVWLLLMSRCIFSPPLNFFFLKNSHFVSDLKSHFTFFLKFASIPQVKSNKTINEISPKVS